MRRHNENPVRAQDDANLAARQNIYACGECGHSGGTLVSTSKDDPKPTYPYRHAAKRFCEQYHFPRRLFAPIAKTIKQMNSRTKQRFNNIGRTEAASRRPQPRPQKAGA